MSSQLWNHMNRMPVAFRKRTTDEFRMLEKKIRAATDQERIKTHRSLEEAVKEAEKAKEYHFLSTDKAEEFNYGSLDGKMLMDNKTARQVFINVCRQLNYTYGGQVITVWYENQWRQLAAVVAELQPETPAGVHPTRKK